MGGNGYPTGPAQCGSADDPTCKVWITSMSQTGPLVVFGFWIFVFLAVVSFQLYRAGYARKHPSTGASVHGKRSITAPKSGQNVIQVEADEPVLRFKGYRTVLAGEFCWWLLILTSLHWIALFVLILVDFYWKCQLTSIDNTCFYGTYFVFGSYDRNGEVSHPFPDSYN